MISSHSEIRISGCELVSCQNCNSIPPIFNQYPPINIQLNSFPYTVFAVYIFKIIW